MTQFFLSLTRHVRTGSRAAIAALGLIVASSSDATPFLSADSGPAGVGNALGICTPPGGAFTSTGPPVSSHAVCAPNGFGEGSALATASIGNLGAEARGRHFGFGTGIGMTGTAAYLDTVVFSGPGSDPVPMRMNLHFGGSVNSDIGGGATVSVRAIVNGTFVGADIVSVQSGVPTCPDSFRHVHFSGLGPCGLTYNVTLQSSLISVPQDTPISFQLDLEASGGGSGPNGSGTSLFSNTFGFIVGGPVFDLPAGFTANSPTSFIVDNRFVPSAVPEPASAVLLLAGLAAMLGVARCRGFKA